MEATSLTFKVGAFLTAGWIDAFSKARKEAGGLSNAFDKIGAKKFSFTGVDKAESDLKKTQSALEKFQKKLGDKKPTADQERELNRLKKNVEDTGKKFDKANQKVSDWKKTLHKNFVDVDAAMRLVKRNDALVALSSQLDKVKERGGAVFDRLKSISLGFSALAGGVVAATASVSNWGTSMAQAAQRLNMFDAAGTANVEQLQRMQWAATRANIGNEEFVATLDNMNRVIGQAAIQGGETAKAFERLGLSSKALSQMGADKQFELIVKKLEGVKNASERARIAQQIWGSGAIGMQNLISRGWNNISADMNEATNYIVRGNANIVKSSAEWDMSMNKLRATWQSVFRGAILSVMPTVTETMNRLRDVIAANREKFAEFVDTVASKVVPIVSWLSGNMDTLASIAQKVIIVMSAWKIMKFVSEITSLGFSVFNAAKSVATFVSSLNFAAVAQKAVSAATLIWSGITKAMTAAQWALNVALNANPIGLVVLAVAALAAAAYAVIANWDSIAEFFSGVWDGIVSGCKKAWEWMSGIFARAKNAVYAVAGAIKDAFANAWNWIKTTLWSWIENSRIYKFFKWAQSKFSGGNDDEPEESAAASAPPISAAELETMSRDAVSRTSSVRTDARTFNTNANISIVQQPGEDSDALAQRISAHLADSYGNAVVAAI